MHRLLIGLAFALGLFFVSATHASPAEAQTYEAQLQNAIYTYFDPGE